MKEESKQHGKKASHLTGKHMLKRKRENTKS